MCAAPYNNPAPSLIAVVDDDASVRQAVGNLLHSVGYDSVGFDSAEAFLATAPLARLGCAVLDIKLRGISGFALQERLVQSAVALPIIFVTGHADPAMEQRALGAGAIAFLRKPIDAGALLGHIAHALAGPGAQR